MLKIGESEALFDEAQEEAGRIGAADVVLGIPTYNHRESVERSVSAALDAAGGSLSGRRVVLIHADGGSRDGTADHVRELTGGRVPLLQVRYPVYPVEKLSAPLAGVPGRRDAALTIFRLARKLEARACVLLDADVESITPEWVERLALPLLAGGVDLVVPVYARHKFDGLINSGILSPLIRALFGKRLRQPSGADMAFSAALMDDYSGRVDGNSPRPAALDPWSTITPITGGFQVGQSGLGPRVAGARAVQPDLSSALRQVLASCFEQMEQSAAFWQKVRGSEEVPWFGPRLDVAAEPSTVNCKPMVDSFRQGNHDLVEIWRLVLPPATLLELHRMERQPEGAFRFGDALWARVIYDFALAWHLRAISRDHLLQAMTPLYLGWVAAFIGEMRESGSMEVEDRLEALSVQFETEKRYLISRWRWPDRFNP